MVVWEAHQMHHIQILRKVQLDWYWTGMSSNMRRLIRTCKVCQSVRHGATANHGHRQCLFASRPWQVLTVDLVGSFVTTKRWNTTILVLSDHFARQKDVIAPPNGTAEVMAEALEHRVFCNLGVRESIHTEGTRTQEMRWKSCPQEVMINGISNFHTS